MGTPNQILKTDGDGNISFADQADASTAVTLVTVTDNYLTLEGQAITSGTIPISLGGTGATSAPMIGVITAADAAAARTALGVDAAGTGSTAVTLVTVTDNYLTLEGQAITSGTIPISLGGTGATSAPMIGVITAADAAASIVALGVDSTAAELNALDGNTTPSSVVISSGDGIIINDDGVIKQVTVPSLESYLLDSFSVNNISDALVEDFSMYIGNDPNGTTDTAEFNIAVGSTALDAITTGDTNIAIGYNSLTANQEGSGNAAIGFQAGLVNTTGSDNVFLGKSAGDVNTTGKQNIIIGNGSDASAFGAENQIVIGYDATGLGDNKAVIGNASITDVYMSQDAEAIVYADGLNLGGTAIATTAAELNIMDGGTAATSTTIADADRIVLNDDGVMVQVAVTDLSTYIGGSATAVTLATVTDNYLTLEGQVITSGTVPISLGGTGVTSVPMIGVITAVDAAAARTAIGTGTIATQNNDAVNIDGGAIDGTAIGATTKTTGAFTTVSSAIYQSNGDTDVTLKTGNATTGNITIANGVDGNIHISPNGTGQVVIDNLTFPAADGDANQILKTDGDGNISFADQADASTAVTLVTGHRQLFNTRRSSNNIGHSSYFSWRNRGYFSTNDWSYYSS